MGTYQAPGAAYMSGLGQAGNTFGNMVNTQASVYNNAMNAKGEMFGTLLGAGSQLGALAMGSDRRLKTNIKQVGVDAKTGLPLYEFNYIPEVKQDGRFVGVMSDDVAKRYPQAVIKMDNGFDAVNYEMLGIEMKQVEEA